MTNEPNQMEPWARAIVEKHQVAMLNELKREYVLRNIVDPLIRKVEQDLNKVAQSQTAKPSVEIQPTDTVQ